MKSYIIIIEKDQQIVDSVSRLVELLNLKPVVFYNWNYKIKTLPFDEIAAIFVNVDVLMIKPEDLLKGISTASQGTTRKVPLIYIYRYEESKNYQKFSSIPHAAELKKPFTLEDFYNILRSIVTVGPLKANISIVEDELVETKNFLLEFDEWLSQLDKLMAV